MSKSSKSIDIYSGVAWVIGARCGMQFCCTKSREMP